MRYMLPYALVLTDVASGRSFYYGQRPGVMISRIPAFDERNAPFQEVGPGGTIDFTIEVLPSKFHRWQILPDKTPMGVRVAPTITTSFMICTLPCDLL